VIIEYQNKSILEARARNYVFNTFCSSPKLYINTYGPSSLDSIVHLLVFFVFTVLTRHASSPAALVT